MHDPNTGSPRLAVIVPCRDDGPLALEAVASVREAEPVEVIVVDNGSAGAETAAAMEELRGRGVRVVRRPPGSIGEGRMSGLAETGARFAFPLDADDLLLPGSLSRLAAALEAAPGAAVAFGDFELFGRLEGVFRAPRRFDPWALTYANFIPSGSLLRREAVIAAGGWDFLNGMEDWDLWLKLAEAGWGGARVEGPVYRKRVEGARAQALGRRNHRRLFAELRRRHAGLFASRRVLARASRPPLSARLAYPLLFGARNGGLVPPGIEAPVYRWMVGREKRRGGAAAASGPGRG
ncbi:MAG: glycosyltransferase family A protein [Solirubrobacterales bacterium]